MKAGIQGKIGVITEEKRAQKIEERAAKRRCKKTGGSIEGKERKKEGEEQDGQAEHDEKERKRYKGRRSI